MPGYIERDELERLSTAATAIETKAGLMALVKLIPTVDIVRCKDCVWYDNKRPYSNSHTLYECRNLEKFFPSDFFCKDGERKEDC